ncbi:MAG: hypothetical protein APR54_12070 [Candidatus Cloacimonas sp. SDB]|nr:MAG: hypothetical protein APR54_12070 [Candidatus Cloacimonas sp. SDB]
MFLIFSLSFCDSIIAQEPLEEIVTFVVPEESYGHSKISARYPAVDINNDGFTDFIMHYRGMTYDEEELYFYYGCSHPDSLPDMIIDIPFDYCGGFPSYGGDLNGDGWKDLVCPIVRTDDQYVYIFFGEENLIPDFDDPDILLNSYDHALDTWELGWNGVNTGTDFNGDGYDDIYVHGDGPSFFFNGQVDIFFGGENMDTEVDFHIMGNEEEWLSSNIAAGDLNGDGCDDLICSRRISEDLCNYEIYLGGEEMDVEVDYVIENLTYGYLETTDADGDLNGDGYEDLIIYDSDYTGAKIYLGNYNFDNQYDFIIPQDNPGNGSITRFYCNINNDNYSDITTVDQSGTCKFYFGGIDFDMEPDLILNNTNQNFAQGFCNLNDFNGDGNNDILINLGHPYNKATVYTIENLVSLDESIYFPNKCVLNNYPNPFNPMTSFSYYLPHGINYSKIQIFNIKGQLVDLINIDSDNTSINWNADKYSSGIYLYKIDIDNSPIKKMMLIK